jgi:hypothetical protein
MIAGLWIAVGVMAVALTVMFGAQVEQFDQLKQLRRVLELEDVTTPVALPHGRGLLASQVGLPAGLDHMPEARVLFLSTKCSTCFVLAEAFRGGVIPDTTTWVVVVPVTGPVNEFMERFELSGERFLVDQTLAIVNSLGLDVTPSMVRISEGRVVEAHTVPSVRQLKATAITRKYAGQGFHEKAAPRRDSNVGA